MDEGNLTIVCKNEHSEVERVQQKISQFCELLGVPARPRHAINLAIDEVLTNIIRHAYAEKSAHEIHIQVNIGDKEISTEISDDGREFDPLRYPPVDCTKPIQERKPGGLGLHLIRSLVNGMEFRRENGKNILTLRQRFR